jgi:hypothetical protein
MSKIIFFIIWGALMVIVIGMATYKFPEEKKGEKAE